MDFNYGKSAEHEPFDFITREQEINFALFILFANGLSQEKVDSFTIDNEDIDGDDWVILEGESYRRDWEARLKCHDYKEYYVSDTALKMIKGGNLPHMTLKDKPDSFYNNKIRITIEEKNEKDLPAISSPDHPVRRVLKGFSSSAPINTTG